MYFPVVLVWLSGVTMAKERLFNVRTFVDPIQVNGFTVAIKVLGDSYMHAAGVAWDVYPGDKCVVHSGEFEAENEGWRSA